MEASEKIRALMTDICAPLILRKITFSRPRDPEIVRAYAVPFQKKDGVYIQIETQRKDGKALHRNVPLGEAPEALTALAQRAFLQTNGVTLGGDFEIRWSQKGKCTHSKPDCKAGQDLHARASRQSAPVYPFRWPGGRLSLVALSGAVRSKRAHIRQKAFQIQADKPFFRNS